MGKSSEGKKRCINPCIRSLDRNGGGWVENYVQWGCRRGSGMHSVRSKEQLAWNYQLKKETEAVNQRGRRHLAVMVEVIIADQERILWVKESHYLSLAYCFFPIRLYMYLYMLIVHLLICFVYFSHEQVTAGNVSRCKEERLWEAQRIVTLLKVCAWCLLSFLVLAPTQRSVRAASLSSRVIAFSGILPSLLVLSLPSPLNQIYQACGSECSGNQCF